tara:strand:+ start:301 stop:528 length:228 start_codon:yes stop_codon:yes gene_type:complete
MEYDKKEMQMTYTLFCVEGFIDNDTITPSVSAQTLTEAEAVFKARVERQDIEVTLWRVAGINAQLIKEHNGEVDK